MSTAAQVEARLIAAGLDPSDQADLPGGRAIFVEGCAVLLHADGSGVEVLSTHGSGAQDYLADLLRSV